MPPPPPSGLDDAAHAAHAWRRFRRILGGAFLVGAMAAAVAVWLVGRSYGPLGWMATLSITGGVVGSVVMAGALMGLAFMSSGVGHDAAVGEWRPADRDPQQRR